MFETFLFVVTVFDGGMVGVIVALLITLMFGDKPGARIAKVLLGITSGVKYFFGV